MYGFSKPTIVHALTTYFSAGITEVLTLEEQSPSKKLELCDVQADSFMRGKRDLDSEEFWRLSFR